MPKAVMLCFGSPLQSLLHIHLGYLIQSNNLESAETLVLYSY